MPALSAETLFTRFWSRVAVAPDGCWLWLGPVNNRGYGAHGKVLAHRQAFAYAKGAPVPDGVVLDHLCRTPLCVRPDHLQPVTQQLNVQRGLAWNGETCQAGHEYTPENTLVMVGRGRRCRKCHAARERARKRGA